MQYLLDTNAWILYLKKPGSKIQARLSTYSPTDVVTCSIVLSELLHGAEKYGNRDRRVAMVRTLLSPFQCVSFDDIDAAQYAILRHDLELRGQVIGPYDLQIAAICLRHSFVLVTSNVSEFARVAGLQIEDWS
jgi:tRNA(fMet)-specific endonuclease VapC